MPPLIDLTGQRFGRWTVISQAEIRQRGGAAWLCKCECGRVKSVNSQHLRGGRSTQCRSCQLRTPKEKIERMRALRKTGKTYPYIARQLGVHVHTVLDNLGPDGERGNWMRGNWRKVRKWRREGLQWPEILKKSPCIAREQFIKSYRREYIRHLRPRLLQLISIRKWTNEGTSAEQIAARLGVTSRTVVRLRRLSETLPHLDLDRIAKFEMRQLTWKDIAERFDWTGDWIEFQALTEAQQSVYMVDD